MPWSLSFRNQLLSIALLQQWVSCLDDWISFRNQESNGLKGKDGEIAANIQKMVSIIEQEIQEVKARIKELIQSNKDDPLAVISFLQV